MNIISQRFLNKTKEKIEDYISSDNAEITILFSSENPSLLGKKLDTTAIELSQKSIRLEVNHEIEIDSVLDIAVKLRDSNREYRLTGNVRYRMPSKFDSYQIVLVLRERADIRSDFKAWKANFGRNFKLAKVS